MKENETFNEFHKRINEQNMEVYNQLHGIDDNSVFDVEDLQKQLDELSNEKSTVNETIAVFSSKLRKVLFEHPEPRNTVHEALGFIEEEMHELRMEVFKKNPRYSQIKDEAYDVMITCARMIAFCNGKLPQEFMPDLKNSEGKYPGQDDLF